MTWLVTIERVEITLIVVMHIGGQPTIEDESSNEEVDKIIIGKEGSDRWDLGDEDYMMKVDLSPFNG